MSTLCVQCKHSEDKHQDSIEQVRENKGVLIPTELSGITRNYRRSYQVLAMPARQIWEVCDRPVPPGLWYPHFNTTVQDSLSLPILNPSLINDA